MKAFIVAIALLSLANGLYLRTHAFKYNEEIPEENMTTNPTFEWQFPPEGTKTFVFFATDLTPSVGGLRWVVYDIPSNANMITKGYGDGKSGEASGVNFLPFKLRSHAEGSGDHQVEFSLYATEIKSMAEWFGTKEQVTKNDIVGAMEGKVLDFATFIGVIHA